MIHGLAGVPSYRVSLQIFLSQTVGRIVVSVVGGMLQPLDAKLGIVDTGIIREQQFSKGILGGGVAIDGCLVEPAHSYFAVWYHKTAIHVQLSHEVLRMDVSALCKFPHTFHGVIPFCQR